MNVRTNLFNNFSCIGGSCKRNCCSFGWTINIDRDTAEYYRSLTDDYGRFIQSFIIDKPDGGAYINIEKGGKCPAQNADGLCDIFIKYGEDKMGYVCKSFPRKAMSIKNECEEALRILYDSEDDLMLIVGEDKSNREELAEVIIRYTDWGIRYIQDENIPLWVALITVIGTGINIGKEFENRNLSGIYSSLDRVSELAQEYVSSMDGLSHDELLEAAGNLYPLIVVAFNDTLGASDLTVYSELMPNPKIYDNSSSNRGTQVMMAYERYMISLSDKDKRFLRRMYANLFTFYSSRIMHDVRNDFLYELAVIVVISAVYPSLWSDDIDTREYLSRLSIMFRFFNSGYLRDHVTPAVRDQMTPDEVSYAIMFYGLFVGI